MNHERNAIIYLDNAATTDPKPESVYTALDYAIRYHGGNAGRGQNPAARQAAQDIATARAKVAALLGVVQPERVIFTPSATIALNQVLLGEAHGLEQGGAIYVSPFEHNSVMRPLEAIRRRSSATLREIPFDPTLSLDVARLRAQFAAHPPHLVAIAHASNVCGLILPVADIAAIVREYNPEAVIIVDAAQTAGLYPLEADAAAQIDYLIFSGHKSFHGPFGVAGFVLLSQRRPRPILFGGTGTLSERLTMPEDIPTAYEPGSHNTPAIFGLAAGADWVYQTQPSVISGHIAALTQRLRAGLRILPGVRVIAPSVSTSAIGIVSFTCAGLLPQELEHALANRGYAVRAGLHCAPLAHQFFGTLDRGGTVRVSPGFFSTNTEIDNFIAELESFI